MRNILIKLNLIPYKVKLLKNIVIYYYQNGNIKTKLN